MDYESTLLTKPECLVYRLPPRTTVRGYRAADWGLDKPAWTGRMRVTAKGKAVSIKVIYPNPNLTSIHSNSIIGKSLAKSQNFCQKSTLQTFDSFQLSASLRALK